MHLVNIKQIRFCLYSLLTTTRKRRQLRSSSKCFLFPELKEMSELGPLKLGGTPSLLALSLLEMSELGPLKLGGTPSLLALSLVSRN